MTKQKHSVSSKLDYTQLNQHFPYHPKQKYTAHSGLKPFGEYMIGPVTGFMKVVETDFLHFVFWEKPLKGTSGNRVICVSVIPAKARIHIIYGSRISAMRFPG